MSIYNHKKYIFIHIPRTGGSSMEQVLRIPTGHAKIQTYYEFLKDFSIGLPKFEKVYKFTFVRHPIDRFISGYKAQGLKLGYINRYILKGKWVDNIYFQPQWRFVCLDASQPLVDFIGRFENIDHDWKVVADKLKIKDKLPYLNQTKGIAELSQRAKDKLRFVYNNDFEMFNYE